MNKVQEMVFAKTPALVDLDSKIRFDVESAARITLSDLDFIMKLAEGQQDVRHRKILYESAVNKVATVFQLAMKACTYLQRSDYKQNLIQQHCKKGKQTDLGVVCSLRDHAFHDGVGIYETELFYPFAHIRGRSYVAMYIKKGAELEIKGLHTFNAETSAYAITSEGIFEVTDEGTDAEAWTALSIFPQVEASDLHTVIPVITNAIQELKKIWKDLNSFRIEGDGTQEYKYVNEGGHCELHEKTDAGMSSYSVPGISLTIGGNLSLTPPEALAIAERSVTYFANIDAVHPVRG